MKKFVLIAGIVFFAFSSISYAKSQKADDENEGGQKSSILQVIVGPMIDVKNWGANYFTAGLAVGGKYFRFGLSYAGGGGIKVVRPFAMIDIPFTFNMGEVSQLAIGPIIDFGPSFGFAPAAKVIDVMVLGFGLDVKFYFNDSLGVSLTPVHFSNSFATYTTGGGGLVKQYRMSYDLLFSFILRW